MNSEKCVVLAGGYDNRLITKSISRTGCKNMPSLSSNHTEADTRIIFHVNVCSHQASDVIVQSMDTDVFVLLIGHFSKFKSNSKIWMHTGTINKTTDLRRFIPIHDLVLTLQKTFPNGFCDALPVIHALTGCDTVSQFSFIGKKTVLSACNRVKTEIYEGLKLLHQATENEEIIKSAYDFVRCIYDSKNIHKSSSINSLRYKLAKANSNKGIDRLPPCEAELFQHIRRASWQANEWNNAHLSTIPLLEPAKSG